MKRLTRNAGNKSTLTPSVDGDNYVEAGDGNDFIFAGVGKNTIFGGGGNTSDQTSHSNSSAGAAHRPKMAGNARQCLSLAFLSNQNAPKKRSAPIDAANELHYARAA